MQQVVRLDVLSELFHVLRKLFLSAGLQSSHGSHEPAVAEAVAHFAQRRTWIWHRYCRHPRRSHLSCQYPIVFGVPLRSATVTLRMPFVLCFVLCSPRFVRLSVSDLALCFALVGLLLGDQKHRMRLST
jgi:hypothetical protein